MESLSILLIGPVQAVGDEPLALGGQMPRGVLAMLALEVGRCVPVDVLTQGLWGERVPAAARSSLAAHISRLRSRGLGPAIVHRGGGYLLDLPSDRVDTRRVGRLHAQARASLMTDPASAVGYLERALELRRGIPLSGLDQLPFVDAVRREWLGRFSAIEHDLAEAMLRSGRGAEVVEDLGARATEHPFAEDIWTQLMRALHAADRREQALWTYRRLRHNLRAGLGIDPSARTERIQQAILRGDLDVVGAGRPGRATGSSREDPVDEVPFVGRTDELQRLHELAHEGRMVTVVGISGVGKTRLISHLFTQADRADILGPWRCHLEGAADTPGVVAAVARAVGVARPDLEAVATAIGARRAWLLLDACERLPDACAEVAAKLLASCPGLTIFATSLLSLALPGEQVLPLSPLSTAAEDGDAAALFLSAAGQRAPEVRVGPHDRAHVDGIVAAVGGIPLAIELAAVQLNHLSVEALAQAVEEQMEQPSERPGTSTRARRTLNAAIAWSVEALPAPTQQVLSGAAIFTGTFTAGALQGVLHRAGGREVPDLPDALAELRERSLLQRIPSDDRPRYRVPDVVRGWFARTRPARRTADLQDAHASWAARLAARGEAGLRTAEHDRWWTRLIDDADNLRAAVDHGLNGGEPQVSLEIAGHLAWHWYRSGDIATGTAVLNDTLAQASQAPPAPVMRARYGLAILAYLAGDLPAVDRAARAVHALEGAPGADPLCVNQLVILEAYALALRGDPAAASRLLDQARITQPEWLVAEVGMVRGFIAAVEGEADRALEELDRAQAAAADVGYLWLEGSIAWIAAKLLIDRGDGSGAAARLRPILRNFLGLGDRSGPLAAAHTMAAATTLAGEPLRGAMILAAVDAVGREMGYDPGQMDPLHGPAHRKIVLSGVTNGQLVAATRAGTTLGYEELMLLLTGEDEKPRPAASAGGSVY